MIEKLGHTKRIQTMRREWIEEEKPKLYTEPEAEATIDSIELPTRLSSNQNGPINGQTEGQADSADDPEQLFMPDPEGSAQQPVTASHPEPDDDDLEDLLREQEEEMTGFQQHTSEAHKNNLGPRDDFDAEYEAMNEMGL